MDFELEIKKLIKKYSNSELKNVPVVKDFLESLETILKIIEEKRDMLSFNQDYVSEVEALLYKWTFDRETLLKKELEIIFQKIKSSDELVAIIEEYGYLTVKQASIETGKSVTAIAKRIKKGNLKYIKIIKGGVNKVYKRQLKDIIFNKSKNANNDKKI